MCDLFGTKAAANAANAQTQMLQAQQNKHDSAVASGKSAIDTAFEQFTPDYFNNYKQSYLDAYNPQLTDQYHIAKDQMTGGLADRGMLESTVGANDFAQLDKTLANREADIGNSATDAENALKGTVNNAKTNLYGLNTAAADPSLMATEAQGAAGTLVAPSSLPTLGNVFAGALAPVASAARTNQGGMYPVGGPMYTQAPGAGSVTYG